MRSVLNIAKILIIALVVLFGVGFAIGTVTMVPDYAVVYIDSNTNTYFSPLSLDQAAIDELGLEKSTLGEAEKLGYDINEDDKQNGYFFIEGSLSGDFLRDIGILPKKDRVDSNGNWLY